MCVLRDLVNGIICWGRCYVVIIFFFGLDYVWMKLELCCNVVYVDERFMMGICLGL